MEIVAAGQIAASQFGLPGFDLARPTSLEQAMTAIDDGDAPPVFLAGGVDLFLQFRNGLKPGYIIDLNGIEELRQISVDNDFLSIGAGARHQLGIANGDVATSIGGLSDAWSLLGNVRVRGMGTLGGNLMARNHRFEGPLFAAALKAELCFQGPDGERRHTIDDVWNDAVDPGLLLTRIDIPLGANPIFAYDRSLRPILTLAAVLEDSGTSGRVSIGTEWDLPVTLELKLNGGSAEEIARATLAGLPQSMPEVDYLNSAGAAILARLIKRMEAA